MKRNSTTSETTELRLNAPLGRLQPYQRCTCGKCTECRDNEKWDRIFAKFDTTNRVEVKGLFQSPLNSL